MVSGTFFHERLGPRGELVTDPYAQCWEIYTALKAIAEGISSAPWRVYTGEASEPKVVPNSPLQNFVDAMNPWLPTDDVWTALVAYLYVEGEVALWLRGPTGPYRRGQVPAEVWPLSMRGWTAVDASGRTLTTNETMPEGWLVPTSAGQKLVSRSEIVRVGFFNPADPWCGFSPLGPARSVMQGAYSAETWNEAYFRNAADPGGYLQAATDKPLTPEQAKQAIERWRDTHQGPSKNGRIGFLNSGMEYKPNLRTQKDMEFRSLLEYCRDAQLQTLGVPKAIVGITDDLNYATQLGQTRVFWERTIIPLLRRIDSAWYTQCWRFVADGTLYTMFDTEGIQALQSDLTERIAQGEALGRLGWTPNQINKRLRLGMPPAPNGDEALGGDALGGFLPEITATDAAADASTTDVPAGVSDVASTAMNGAQVQSLVEIAALVAAGELPSATAIEVILAAFPTITPEQAAKIVNPAAASAANPDNPPAPEPAPSTDQDQPQTKAARRALKRLPPRAVRMRAIMEMRATIKRAERVFARDLARYFKSLTEAQLESLARYLNDHPEIPLLGMTSAEAEAVLFSRDEWDRKLRDVAEPHINAAVTAGVRSINKELGTQIIQATDPRVVAVASRLTGNLIRVNQYTRERMKAVIVEETSGGKTVSEIQEAIQERVGSPNDKRGVGGFARSLRIARTETGFATSTARYMGMQEAGVTKHEWSTGRNPRASHRDADGEIVEIGQPFSNGLTHPHQIGAPPEEVINCNCTTLAVIDV